MAATTPFTRSTRRRQSKGPEMLLSALAAVLLLVLATAQLRAAARALDGHLPGAHDDDG